MKDYWKNEANEKAIDDAERQIQLDAAVISCQDVKLLQMLREGEIDEIQFARAYREQVQVLRESWNKYTKLRNRSDFR
jgi:hypothetical protein